MKNKAGIKQKHHSRPGLWVLAFILALIILAALSLRKPGAEDEKIHENLENALQEEGIGQETLDPKAKILLNISGDFQNDDQGTFFTTVKLNLNNIATHFQRIPKYIVFFESKTLPRLTLRYNLHDSVIEGGIPLMKTQPLQFMDTNPHKVVYSFNVKDGQAIFFDGQRVAFSPFQAGFDAITANTVLDVSSYTLGKLAFEGEFSITGSYLGSQPTLP